MILRLCSSLLFATLATACLTDASATGEDTSTSLVRDHRPPPPGAIEACDGSSAGAACAFAADGGQVTGHCREAPDGDGPLGCAPEHPPPPAALDVCNGSPLGASCAFDIDGHHVDGECRNAPDGGGPLACAPVI